MPATLDLVRLHPATVQNPPRRLKNRPRARARASSGLRALRVDPEVWATALRLAGGDALRIDVTSSTQVTVRVRNRT